MSKRGEKRKDEQLGMPIGTASNRLRKLVVFSLLKSHNENICYRCGEEIKSENDLSIDHKEPWLDSDDPVGVFFDLNNIAFSHLKCNRAFQRYKISNSGFKGVSMPKDSHTKFRAIFWDGKGLRVLGSYDTAEEAAIAYDKKAIEKFGDAAVTNNKLGLLPH